MVDGSIKIQPMRQRVLRGTLKPPPCSSVPCGLVIEMLFVAHLSL